MEIGPSVSVIVPVYNRASLLRECLDSVAAQTLGDWECLVVDDGSIDGSADVAVEYQSRDRRFRALARPPSKKGAAACRNHGLGLSAGRYVIFLDSDDLLHPECLSRRVDFMQKQGEHLDFATFPTLTFRQRLGDCDILWNIDKGSPDLLRFMRLDTPWSITGPIWKADAARAIGGFDETLPGWQDWQIHVVALLENLRHEPVNSPPDCYVRTNHGDQISKSASSQEHILRKTEYLSALVKKYREQLHTDEALRAACAGLMWYQVVQLEQNSMPFEAISYWRHMRKLRYIGARNWLEGTLALVFHGKPGGSLAWRAVKDWREQDITPIDRSTCHAIHLNPAIEGAQAGLVDDR